MSKDRDSYCDIRQGCARFTCRSHCKGHFWPWQAARVAEQGSPVPTHPKLSRYEAFMWGVPPQDLSIYAEFVEEYFVPHFCVAQQLRPANYLHVETDVAEPVKPSKSIGLRSEVFLLLEPVFDLFWSSHRQHSRRTALCHLRGSHDRLEF